LTGSKRKNLILSLIPQVQASKELSANVIAMRSKQASIDISGRHLHVVFAGGSGQQEIYDLSFLQQFPQLSKPFLEAFKRRALNMRNNTRLSFIKKLRRGFCAFLTEQKAFNIGLEQFSRAPYGKVSEAGWTIKRKMASHGHH
jgi:hypothetical protein